MSLAPNHADGPFTNEVVHLAGHPDVTGQHCARCGAVQLAREPLCRDCGKVGIVEGANEVDHVTPRERFPVDLQGSPAPGGSDHPSNLQSLCKRCHSRKTAVEDGRWTPRPLRAHDVNGG